MCQIDGCQSNRKSHKIFNAAMRGIVYSDRSGRVCRKSYFKNTSDKHKSHFLIKSRPMCIFKMVSVLVRPQYERTQQIRHGFWCMYEADGVLRLPFGQLQPIRAHFYFKSQNKQKLEKKIRAKCFEYLCLSVGRALCHRH